MILSVTLYFIKKIIIKLTSWSKKQQQQLDSHNVITAVTVYTLYIQWPGMNLGLLHNVPNPAEKLIPNQIPRKKNKGDKNMQKQWIKLNITSSLLQLINIFSEW